MIFFVCRLKRQSGIEKMGSFSLNPIKARLDNTVALVMRRCQRIASHKLKQIYAKRYRIFNLKTNATGRNVFKHCLIIDIT